jgi:hypothetical protein
MLFLLMFFSSLAPFACPQPGRRASLRDIVLSHFPKAKLKKPDWAKPTGLFVARRSCLTTESSADRGVIENWGFLTRGR